MNFLLRPTQSVGAEPSFVHETPSVTSNIPKPTSTLESVIADDSYPQYLTIEDRDGETDGTGGENGSAADLDAKNYSIIAKHSDVFEEEGWITIPYKELADNWNDAPDINSLRSLDRPFVFPGEQVHILVCLSACKQDTEIITPFKVAAVMSKNGKGQSPNKENGNTENVYSSAFSTGEMSPSQETDQNSEKRSDVSAGESLLRMEDHKRQTVMLLQRFEKSHFFVRIAESGEPLWSRKTATRKSSESSDSDGTNSTTNDARKIAKVASCLNAVVDKGNFDPRLSGGAARNIVKCCSLRNGDIVVLLEVNVGDDYLNDPVIEILQFEKYHERPLFSENHDSISYGNQDPCGELLKWLLPLDNTLPPPGRPLSPPVVSTSGFGSPSQKSGFSSSSGSHLFSFGNFRSYSMSALPQNTVPPPAPIKATSSKPSFDLEDWDQYSSQKLWRSQRTGSEGILSFRGVSLERERFSVRCGLEGIYIPGRRWKRKVEIIQPIEINSFATDCNTDDLLCVQIKNVSPAHAPEIVVYVDAITIVFEEASKSGQPSPLPIACTEAGEDHSLPNLALRRGEEHSFILKPVTSMWKSIKPNAERSTMRSQKQAGNATSNLRILSKTIETKKNPTVDQYAINVSCRCNYTESRLFFKQPTSWRPRISRDLLISVASEMSGQHGHNGGVPELPVQELTLQVSNLTSEEQTLTVLAPASFTSPPSVVSLNSAPTSPLSPFVGFPEFTGRIAGDRHGSAMRRLSSAPLACQNQKQNFDGGASSVSLNECASQQSDVIPSSGFGCTHLWLQSRVPLGCVPSHSTATVKLELLPLTDGIITLDTLQIDVKEKGLTYIPEHSLKINATSGISTGVH